MSWKILKQIYAQEKNNTLKACFNLSEQHITPSAFEKMSVELDSQVFSLNVSAGTELGIALNIFKLEEIAKLKQFKKCCALYSKSAETKIINNLKDSKVCIEKWAHLKTVRPPCFDVVIQTINGVLLIWNALKNTRTYFITLQINQDPLENSISILRRNKRSYEKNPSAYRISRNMRLIAFQNFITSTLTRCNISHAETLCAESTILAHESAHVEGEEKLFDAANQRKELDEFLRIAFSEDESTERRIEVIQIIDDEEDSATKEAGFLHGNLTVPSAEFIKYVKDITNHFENEIVLLRHESGIVEELIQ